MSYTPDATDTAAPADAGVLAATAAAEFRAIKAYMASVLLAGLALKAPITNASLVTPNLGTPSAGNLGSCTVDGTNAVGFRTVPQNSQSAPYTCVLTDSGKHIFHPSADTTARTFTIPANASVAYPIGTVLTFINQISAGVITIAITSDTMYWSPTGVTGSRSLAAHGIATATKITATAWLLSGVGLT